jgi:hypothetical protein
MPSGSVAAFDTNFFDHLSRIDSECSLIELFVLVFEVDRGVADHGQLRKMDYCTDLCEKLDHHGYSDGEILDFVRNAPRHLAQQIDKISEDLADLGLLLAVRDNSESVLLTCDRRLLFLAKDMGEVHYCFKASVHELEDNVGGVISESDYDTGEMFTGIGNPFFDFGMDRHCPRCDPSNSCRSRQDVP